MNKCIMVYVVTCSNGKVRYFSLCGQCCTICDAPDCDIGCRCRCCCSRPCGDAWQLRKRSVV